MNMLHALSIRAIITIIVILQQFYFLSLSRYYAFKIWFILGPFSRIADILGTFCLTFRCYSFLLIFSASRVSNPHTIQLSSLSAPGTPTRAIRRWIKLKSIQQVVGWACRIELRLAIRHISSQFIPDFELQFINVNYLFTSSPCITSHKVGDLINMTDDSGNIRVMSQPLRTFSLIKS